MPTTTQRDYYEVLGVPRDADAAAIKRAFRKLAMRYHPDRSREPDAQERFKEIAEAYAVLSDPKKRAAYDAQGFSGVEGFSAEDLFSGLDLGDLFGDLGFPGARGGGLFDRVFGRRRSAGPPRGPDIEVELTVGLDRVLTGGRESVTVHRPSRCDACQGSGAQAGTQPRTCEECKGTGQKVVTRTKEHVYLRQVTTCQACHGHGTVIDHPCPDCGGRRLVERAELLTVELPPGIEDGTVLQIPGQGMPSPAPGGVPGDVYVVVVTGPDPRFVRRGAELWRTEVVSVPDAVLGTSRDVPTLDGPVSVTIPPGTQPGQVVRVPGRGLPRMDGRGRGDLAVAIVVHVPDHVSAAERRLYEQLRDRPA